MRKPHVFISSRLALGKVRTEIRDLLSNSGFSVEIYEADSTPSTEPATYLRDIGYSDFVVFILDQSYGTPRGSTGKSGVHEEWEIVKSKGIPNHVYLKRNRKKEVIEAAQKKFIRSELQNREISYFYYTSVPQLLQQIQQSIVRMAMDIAQSSEFRSGVTNSVLAGEIAIRDHDTFFLWDRALSRLNSIEVQGNFLTDGWATLLDLFPSFTFVKTGPFVDMKVQQFFGEFLQEMAKLSHYEGLQTVDYAGDGPTIALPREPTVLKRLKLAPPLPHDFHTKRDQLKNQVLEKWTLVRELVLDRYSRYGHLLD